MLVVYNEVCTYIILDEFTAYPQLMVRNRSLLFVLLLSILVSLGFIFSLIHYSFQSLSGALTLYSKPVERERDDSSQVEAVTDVFKVQVQDDQYSYNYVKIPEGSDVVLIPNFNPEVTAEMIASEHHCQYLINGSYYSKENQPLGGFVSNGTVLKDFTSNPLLDGVLFADDSGIHIELGEPVDEVKWALQAGPLVTVAFEQTRLSIKDDKFSRRMVIAQDSTTTYLFVIFGDESVYSGPMLGDLPKIMTKIADDLGLNWKSALNLDGGSASAFIGDNLRISERTWIGSAICVKK